MAGLCPFTATSAEELPFKSFFRQRQSRLAARAYRNKRAKWRIAISWSPHENTRAKGPTIERKRCDLQCQSRPWAQNEDWDDYRSYGAQGGGEGGGATRG